MATMTHKDLGGVTIEVEPSAVPIHMASGWVPVDGKAVEAAEAAKAAADAERAEALKAAEDAIKSSEDEASASARKTKPAAKES